MRERPEIALTIVTREDPIHVDTKRITAALSAVGYTARVVGTDWATAYEWDDLLSPVEDGRHNINSLDAEDYVVRWYGGVGCKFVRDYADHERELEPVL